MGALRTRRRHWLVLVVRFAAGCSRQDSDRLARVGRKTVDRAEALIGRLVGNLTGGSQGPHGISDPGLEVRVSGRLRTDKSLADTPIVVEVKGTVVELKGSVRDLAQRRRAVDLAASTVGVEKVNDLLQTPERAP